MDEPCYKNKNGGWDCQCKECLMFAARPPTPARGKAMPRTIEYYIKRGDMDQELIMEQKEEISRLKQKVNNLRQKRDSQNVNDVSIL